MPSFDKPPLYQAYLLRIWGERGGAPEDSVVWRFSVEDALTGERRGLADLQTLLAFLADQIGEGAAQEKTDTQDNTAYLR